MFVSSEWAEHKKTERKPVAILLLLQDLKSFQLNSTWNMRKYRLVAKKGEGTFSEVLKAQNVKDGRYHAIKCMKNRFESIDQVIINQKQK